MRKVASALALSLIFFVSAIPAASVPPAGRIDDANSNYVPQQSTLSSTTGMTLYLPIVLHNYATPMWRSLGLHELAVKAVAFQKTDSDDLYVGTSENGIYKSSDGGKTWFAMNNGLRVGSSVYLIATDQNHAQTLYTAIPNYPRLYFTDNGGQSWLPRDQVPLVPSALAIYPSDSKHLLLGVGASDIWGGGGNLYRSDDGGIHWTQVFTQQVLASSIIILPHDPLTAYAAGTGLYRSSDGGNTWEHLTEGLPDSYIWDFVLHPNNPMMMYLTTKDGVFKTLNGGNAWSKLSDNLPVNNAWKLVADDNVLFAASPCLGVYTSLDGSYWHAINDGLGDLCVYDVALDKSAHRIYAGTSSGVWVLDLKRGVQ
jgi:photosystem II stability/assembly factor-like uncharacterized protein